MKKCEICLVRGISSQKHYCSTCKKLIDRASRKRISRKAAVKALKNQSDEKGGFFCYYSGVPLLLKTTDKGKPRYITFDHRTPRDKNHIVMAAAIINDMKSDMDEKEFKLMVGELYRNLGRKKKNFSLKAFQLKHYKRK